MLVFDAYPLAAVLLDEPVAEAVAPLLGESLGESSVAAINAAEVVDLVARTSGAGADEVASAVELWVEGGMTVVDLDWALARRAADLRATHYHRTRTSVSIADCTAIALAERLGATLVTSDQALRGVAESTGIEVTFVAAGAQRRR